MDCGPGCAIGLRQLAEALSALSISEDGFAVKIQRLASDGPAGQSRPGWQLETAAWARRQLKATMHLFGFLQQFLAIGIDFKHHGVGLLVDGRDLVQEQAVLLLACMRDSFQISEGSLHFLASLERRGHLS